MRRPRGRPVNGTVTNCIRLLPEQWDYLRALPESTSATIRRLVDQEMARDRRDTTRSVPTPPAGDPPTTTRR